jgi:hypothetical protein
MIQHRVKRLEGVRLPAQPASRADLQEERLFAILAEIGPAPNMTFIELWDWWLNLPKTVSSI